MVHPWAGLRETQLGFNPHSRGFIPEGTGKSMVSPGLDSQEFMRILPPLQVLHPITNWEEPGQPWVGLPATHTLLPDSGGARQARKGYFAFPKQSPFLKSQILFPNCCREVLWLLSNCFRADQSLGWWQPLAIPAGQEMKTGFGEKYGK